VTFMQLPRLQEQITEISQMWRAIPFERLTRPYAPLVGYVCTKCDEPHTPNRTRTEARGNP
jgi:hypothetical protein